MTWDDYQVSKEIRDDWRRQAAERRRLRELPRTRPRFARLVVWAADRLGGWLIALGTRLQARSATVANGLRAAGAGAVQGEVACADRNC